MKKYKLKKDLPLAKAGEEVFINENIYMICKYWKDNCVIPISHIKMDEINEWLEEIPEKSKSMWELEEWDEYWTINYGTINKVHWKNDIIDNKTLSVGNIFPTSEEAKKEFEKRKAIQKIKKYCWKNAIDTKWNSLWGNYCFLIDSDNKIVFDWYNQYFRSYSPIWFFSENNAQIIAEKFPEELKLIIE